MALATSNIHRFRANIVLSKLNFHKNTHCGKFGSPPVKNSLLVIDAVSNLNYLQIVRFVESLQTLLVPEMNNKVRCTRTIS